MTLDDTAKETSPLRFSDVGALPNRMFAPIEGYEHMPLVSLEEAVEPLVNIVPKVQRNVFIVKQNCQHPEDGLSSDESASIMLYTFESKPHESSLYVILNAALRLEKREQLVPWFLYLRLILTALGKLPSERRFVVRGVKADLRAEYPKGNTFIWWGFSSCTSTVEVLECEGFFGKTGTRTLFQIDCYTGKDVKNHSFIRAEEEILLLPARQFQITSCLDSGNGLHIIQLKEIKPSFPLLELSEIPNPVLLPKKDSTIGPQINVESSKPAPALASTLPIEKHNSVTDGYGSYTSPDGGHYEGEFKDGEMHGRGTYRFSDGDTYDGGWEHDSKCGYGIYTWTSGQRYEGQYHPSIHQRIYIHWQIHVFLAHVDYHPEIDPRIDHHPTTYKHRNLTYYHPPILRHMFVHHRTLEFLDHFSCHL
ncbi:unnamed protein product [Adineta ricciae]|uniref:NAD(P)(+)--arginine ADP-ribosyltransferase n=1 Tax=Adineta ricciae TaxID=249248 RepID=A0A816A922_ADIRI|nr:unnamed protein product [Adineta ricciae]